MGKDLNGTALLDYLGLTFIADGEDESVELLAGIDEQILYMVRNAFMGGTSPHYLIDELEANENAYPILKDDTGIDRMFVYEDLNYKVVSSSIVIGALANGNGFSSKNLLLGEIINYFLDVIPVGVEEVINVSPTTGLTVYPNPVSDIATIQFEVAQAGFLMIRIFDLSGQQVTTIADHYFTPGNYSLVWNGKDFQGNRLPPGMYLLELITDKKKETCKVNLMNN